MNKSNKEELLEKADQVLCEIRPHLWADEGDIKVIEITDKFVLILEWEGACISCDLRNSTLNFGIKQAVMEQVEEITDVIVAQ